MGQMGWGWALLAIDFQLKNHWESPPKVGDGARAVLKKMNREMEESVGSFGQNSCSPTPTTTLHYENQQCELGFAPPSRGFRIDIDTGIDYTHREKTYACMYTERERDLF